VSAVTWIAIASVVLSVLTFVATQFGSRRTANASYLTQLENRVAKLERDLVRCEERGRVLFDENVALMRKLQRNGS
jgi:membrane protein implicated in regulation of membrane protease activity